MRNISEVRSAGKEAFRRTALKVVRSAKHRLERYEANRPQTIRLSKEDIARIKAFEKAAFQKVKELDRQRGR